MRLVKRNLRLLAKSMASIKRWKRRLVFWTGAVVVGLLSALFAISAELASDLFRKLVQHSPYWPLLVSPLGLVLVAWLTRRYFPGSQGSGIPQSIAALQETDVRFRRSVLSLRIAFGKILLTLLGLLSGASIGREGPTVHIGASVMYALGRFAQFRRHHLDHGLIVAGGAAGIAAAFNTPLAGIVFAIEEMSRSFEERSSGTILSTVLFAGVTALAILGNYNYFGTTSATLGAPSDWLAVPVAGVAGGLLGGIFSTLLIRSTRAIAPVIRRHPLAVPAACGLAIALLGLLSGGLTYGTGYQEASHVITGGHELPGYYAFTKMAATLVSYVSGIPGGIFAPTLATGAGLGANLTEWITVVPFEAMVLLTMVAYFAGVVQTPITGFVVVMEMTESHAMLLPLMAAAMIGYGVSSLICDTPIYRALALAFTEKAR